MRALANIGEYLSPAVPEICNYWLAKVDGRSAPTRAEIDPLEMPKGVLPHILLVDLERQTRQISFRLVGTHVAHMYGSNFTGASIDEIILPHGLTEALRELYGSTMDLGEPIVGHYGYPMRNGRQALSEFALLPLQSHGAVTQCLAVEHLGALGGVDPEDLISLRRVSAPAIARPQ
ncbi:PAS domain-containing protein [Dongia soli]|uniref:PAS domain-containing protein n=1 Tax=Dongia soli TaxID=600628 RepID=A0ABU5EGG5_9PROT|nr:PAS domain-containing protein [Dongia soli]MDY0885311.1 PAS domain-containing protein [Dongia soli]